MSLRTSSWLFAVCILSAVAAAQSIDPILANQNRTPAGKLENGVLTLKLELINGAWHPEADDGPQVTVAAFAEAFSLLTNHVTWNFSESHGLFGASRDGETSRHLDLAIVHKPHA